jgi:hypothetical protein
MTAAARILSRDMAARLGRDGQAAFRRRMPDPPQAFAIGETEAGVGMARRLANGAMALAAFAAMLAVAAVRIGGWLGDSDHSADPARREIVIGNDVVLVAGNHIRFASQRRNGTAERLDLHFHWPDMAGYGEGRDAAFDAGGLDPSVVYVSLEPRTMRLDMSGRMEPIYAKFLRGPEIDAGNGLKRRALDPEPGFVAEDFYWETASPWPFAARCVRADPATGGGPWCLRDIHAGRDLSVTYRFHVAQIGEWMALDAAVRAFVNEMLAR